MKRVAFGFAGLIVILGMIIYVLELLKPTPPPPTPDEIAARVAVQQAQAALIHDVAGALVLVIFGLGLIAAVIVAGRGALWLYGYWVDIRHHFPLNEDGVPQPIIRPIEGRETVIDPRLPVAPAWQPKDVPTVAALDADLVRRGQEFAGASVVASALKPGAAQGSALLPDRGRRQVPGGVRVLTSEESERYRKALGAVEGEYTDDGNESA